MTKDQRLGAWTVIGATIALWTAIVGAIAIALR